MAYLEANGHDVTEGLIEIPKIGRAVADLRIATPASESPIAVGDAVTLTFEDGTEFKMACARAGDLKGTWQVRLVGGAGKMGNAVKAKFYSEIESADFLKDVLREVGEEAGTIDLPGQLKFWSRLEGTGFSALQALMLNHPKRIWRIGRDGKLTAFIPAATTGPDVTLVEALPASNRYILAVAPTLEPLQTIEFGDVDRVVHRISGGKLRTEAWIE